MDAIHSGWFSELSHLWPSQSFSLEVDEVLHREKTQFQDLMVFKSKTFGNVLVLDGIIQCAEKDEFTYPEMMAHVPLFAHPDPKTVLIVGGGDGGCVREAIKHPSVKEVHLCEIDERVIELSKQYLPSLTSGLTSSKVTINIGDGLKYLESFTNKFDVVITDSSDPVGPATALFEKEYYASVSNALTSNGIMCCQEDGFWLDTKVIKKRLATAGEVFPVVEYCAASIPSYPCGQNGFLLASKNTDVQPSLPKRTLTPAQVKEMGLCYYNTDIHKAAFVMPQFARDKLFNEP